MNILVIGLAMLLLDTVYLRTAGITLFKPLVETIQSSEMRVRLPYAAVVYALLLLAFYLFVIRKKASVVEAFMLGLCIYGVFDFTNMALFDKYSLGIAIVDTVWGGILFATLALIHSTFYD
jgi:uncharacterized membrane protein